MGDAFYAIHDWLFIEQFLFASLAMPIAVNMVGCDEDQLEEKKTRAKKITLVARYSFYALLFAWFLLSSISGQFLYRMSINLIFFYQTVVFTLSLCAIKRLIYQIDTGATT